MFVYIWLYFLKHARNTLRWQFRVTDIRTEGFTLEAWGDFHGRGIWTFEQDGSEVNVIYDWKIMAEKPLLRYFSFLMKPIFAANHRWAMAKGEESLKLELARRHASTSEERACSCAATANDLLFYSSAPGRGRCYGYGRKHSLLGGEIVGERLM